MKRILFAIFTAFLVTQTFPARAADEFKPVQSILDFSGLAWLGGDRFLIVHDAKNPDELDRVRVSLVTLPKSLEGLKWLPLEVTFPETPSSDLESAAAIPNTSRVLLLESADNGSAHRRIFLGKLENNAVSIEASTEWDQFTDPFNIEAAAVVQTDRGLLFVWAERASGQQTTSLSWSMLTLDPFAISPPLSSAAFSLPADWTDEKGRPLYSRPIVGLDVDASGQIFAIATFDPEDSVPNPDNGPFRSAIMRIGSVGDDGSVTLEPEPKTIARLDGLKVEGIAARDTDEGTEVFIGSDDENYGGTLRQLP